MTSRVLVALRVKATPQRAFEAFTAEIGEWWRPNDLFAFTPRSPGVMSFEAGKGGRFLETLPNGKVFEAGRILTWEPGARLTFSWRCAGFPPGVETTVDVAFEPIGDETRVSVEHSGWESVPQDHVARHGFPLQPFLLREAEWWQELLGSLRDRIAGRI